MADLSGIRDRHPADPQAAARGQKVVTIAAVEYSSLSGSL
jgi:hypothetical protein